MASLSGILGSIKKTAQKVSDKYVAKTTGPALTLKTTKVTPKQSPAYNSKNQPNFQNQSKPAPIQSKAPIQSVQPKQSSSKNSSKSSNKSSNKSSGNKSVQPMQSLAPIQSVPMAQSNPSQGLLGGMQNPFVQKVYAQTPGMSSVSDTRASGGSGIRQVAGNVVDAIGTAARKTNLPWMQPLFGGDLELSERIAGGNTQNTGSIPTYRSQINAAGTQLASAGQYGAGYLTGAFAPATLLRDTADNLPKPPETDVPTSPYGPDYDGPLSTANLGGTTADPQQYFDQAQKVAENMTDDEIASALIEYDRVKAELANQQGFLGSQKESALAQYDAQAKALQAEIERRKAGTYESAKNAERANRNTLRALGILGSSAAGELLTRPLTQAEGSVAQLDQMWLEKQSELDLARNDLETQYARLVEQINTDLRFNERERTAAVQQATTAANERLMQIEQQKLQWAQAIDTMKKQAAIDMAKIRAY